MPAPHSEPRILQNPRTVKNPSVAKSSKDKSPKPQQQPGRMPERPEIPGIEEVEDEDIIGSAPTRPAAAFDDADGQGAPDPEEEPQQDDDDPIKGRRRSFDPDEDVV